MKIRSLFLILLLAVFASGTTSFAQQTMTIGTGTDYVSSGSNAGSSFGSPFGNCYYYNATAQFIYTTEEMNGAKTITSVAFNHNGKSFNANVNIYLFHTTASTVATNDPATSGTPVYTGSGIAVGGSSAGWQTFQLTTPFEYNGTDNLLVVVCRSKYNSGWSNAITWQYSATTDNKFMVRSSDTDGCGDITNTNFSYSASTSRPNIQIGYQTTDPYISLAPASETVLTGFTKTLTATYGNVTGTPTITYTSSNEGVATVSGNGTTATVTGEAPGTATITATMSYQGTDYTATAAITVEDPSYCEPSFNDAASYDIYITDFTTSVGINNINNSTGCSTGGYGDYYDTHAATLEPGEALDFTVSQGSTYDCGFAIWVDWNQDYEFSADERVAATSAKQTTSWSGSFSVPSATAVGDYRMRVLMQYNTSSPSNPCVSASYGEGEDYKLSVVAPSDCPRTNSLTAQASGDQAVLSWTSTATAWQVCINDDESNLIEVTENPYTLENLNLSTTYTVKVRANCTTSGNGYGEWSNTYQFTTGACTVNDMCNITLELTDSYGDGWSGNAIKVVNAATGEVLGQFTNLNLNGTTGPGTNELNTHILPICPGLNIRFEWVSGSGDTYPEECSWVVKDFNGEEIFSGSNATGYTTGQILATWTSRCTPDDCPNPDQPTQSEVTAHSAKISWEGNGLTEFNLEYIYAGYNEWFNMPNVTSPCTIEGLPANTEIQVRVQGTCDAANNEWSETLYFMTDVSCPVPTNVRITEGPTAHEITITWDAQAGEMFQYAMLHGTVTDFTNVNWGTPEETNTASWNTLYADYDWTFAIRKYCGESDQSEVVSLTFTTLVACPAPTTPAVTDITGHTATLNWTGTSESYNVYWRTPASWDGENADFSSVPTGWLFRTGALNTDGTATLSGTSSWSWSSTMNNVLDGYHYYTNLYGSNVNYWMITPILTVKEGYGFSFDAAYTPYNSNNALATSCTTHRFVVLISTDNMATWTILREWNNSGTGTDVLDNLSQTGETINVSLASYVGQEVNIAFFAHAETTSYDNNIHIDNVKIGFEVPASDLLVENADETTIEINGLDPETTYEAYIVGDCGTEGYSAPSSTVTFTTTVACLPVGTLAEATEVKSTSAKLSWTLTDDTQDFWQVAYSPSPLGAGYTYVDATTNNGFLLEGLYPETLYYVKVRANCGSEDGYGEWSNEISFITLRACFTPYNIVADNITSVSADLTWTGEGDSYNVMYREVITAPVNVNNTYDFETGNLQGWTTISNDNDDYAWTVESTSGYAHGGSRYARSRYTSSTVGGDANDWLISPQIPLGGTFSFYARKYTSSGTDKFQVYVSTSGNNISDFTAISEVIAPNATYDLYEYDLSSYSGNGYVAIVYTAPNDQYYVYVDDINYTYTSAGEYGDWQSATSTTESVTLENLTANKTYEVKVQGVCGSTEGEWSDIFEFTTPVPFFTKEIKAYTDNEDYTDGWYLIASPLYLSISVGDVEQMTDNEFDLYRFNQAPTANGEGQYLEWENYKSHTEDFLIESGIGYLYANSGNVTLTFTGNAYEDISEYEKAIQLRKTDVNPDVNMHGWNLVGNPYGRINAYIDREFYVMNPDGNDIVPSGERNYIEPMEGVFVLAQEDQELFYFHKTPANSTGNKGALSINVTEAANHRGNGLIDRAVVRFNEGDALPKFQLNPNHSKVYITQGNKDYSVVRSNGQGEMPVNFRANKNGQYTLMVNADNVEMSYLHLIDNMTGADIDLLQTPSYSFNATTSDYESRFRLVFATGANDNSDSFAFFSNGNLIVSNEGQATLQVVDVNGRILSSRTINGSASVKVDAAPGVYVLRLINGTDVKVQKVVVR